MPRVSCGVVVTDGRRILLGHSTGNRHWDIPKGQAEEGETECDAAARELLEETGLRANPHCLVPLGRFHYRRDKDLSLFLMRCNPLPEPADLVCISTVDDAGRPPFPEFDGFVLAGWEDLPALVTSRMAERLAGVRRRCQRILASDEPLDSRSAGDEDCDPAPLRAHQPQG